MLEEFTELRKALYLQLLAYYKGLKDIIKDTNKQPDKEVHRVRSGRVSSAGPSVSMDLGCTTFLAHECIHKT